MRVFVTGASGFVGSAVLPELLDAGHQVIGLARSDASAAALTAAGVAVQRGSLDDLDSLRAGAAAADGIVHLAFIHDFADYVGAAQADVQAIETLGAALEGSGRPLVITAGLLGLTSGGVATERDMPDPVAGGPRSAGTRSALALVDKGVRASVVRLAPSVHDRGDHGFIPTLIGVARQCGVSGYIDDGANRWPAVHRRDAARLFRLALENGAAGSAFHGVGDEGVPTREIAEVIGQHLGVPTVSVPRSESAAHFGWIGMFFGADMVASSALTHEALGWQPTHPGLIADLEEGHYFNG